MSFADFWRDHQPPAGWTEQTRAAGPQLREMSHADKLELAAAINRRIDALCEDLGYETLDAPEVLVLALYARTDSGMRECLFPGGFK